MSPLPAEFTNRRRDRAEPAPGEGLVYWHMLVGGYPEGVAIAPEAQKRLASFSGLHMTPLIAGPASLISEEKISRMAKSASRLLAGTGPVTVALGEVLYHPEAIVLAATPVTALAPVREAALAATREITGTGGPEESTAQWRPHVTVCYSTSRQPAEPVIAALGRSLPEHRPARRLTSGLTATPAGCARPGCRGR